MQKLYSKKNSRRERKRENWRRTEHERKKKPNDSHRTVRKRPKTTYTQFNLGGKKTIKICGMVGKLKSTEMVDNFMDPPPKQIKLGMVFIIYTLKKIVKPSILIQFIPFYPQIRVPKMTLKWPHLIGWDDISMVSVQKNSGFSQTFVPKN